MADVSENVEHYTYRNYLEFPENMRCELIDGEVFMMASPSDWHQAMVVELCGQLRDFFRGKPCRVRVAPFDVRLFPKDDNSDDVVVQPDIMVICDESKRADGRSCRGAPDFIIEVLSRSTRSHDLLRKRSRYEKAGVREYWAVGADAVFKYVLADGVYLETAYPVSTKPVDVPVDLFAGCVLRFDPNLD